jgi:hypothetical protein
MPKIEYLDPEIANEGERADAAFAAPRRPHVWDYAQLKEHPHYGQYWAPKPFSPWPAVIYNHKTGEEKTVKDGKEAMEYGVGFNRNLRHPDYEWTGDWQAEPRKDLKPNIHVTGKSLVTASAERVTADSMTKILHKLAEGKATPEVSPAIAEAISADKEYQEYLAFKRAQAAVKSGTASIETDENPVAHEADPKSGLVQLAKEKGIHVDKRWGLDRIQAALDSAA